MKIAILVAWAIADLFIFVQYVDSIKKNMLFGAISVILIGGPFFIVTSILQSVLDCCTEDGGNGISL